MKYCLNCGRELFDRDNYCDKCNHNIFIYENECNKIIREINNANKLQQKILLKNDIYKKVYDLIINKPKEHFNYNVPNNNFETEQEHFNRINKHTINNPQQTYTPKCPICGSTNLSKISTVTKATKIELFGIFGAGDIGKTWKCKNCGSRF